MNLHRAYFTLFPQRYLVTPRAHGIDMSKYDQYFLPAEIKGQVDFVVQRVSYGVTRDEAFFTLVGGVMQIPIRGGYHYLSSWYPWREQADKYLSFIQPYEYHFHVCDLEGAFNTLSTGFSYSAWQYIHYIQQKTNQPCLLYTNVSTYNQYIYPSQSQFSINWNDVDLWLAQYLFIPNPDGTPSTPTGRTRPWKLWQYTSKGDGTLYGVARPTACDLDVYNGTVAEMKSWLKISSAPEEHTSIFDGAEQYAGVKNNRKYWIQIIDPTKVTYEVFEGYVRRTVSSVANQAGAKIAVNGGDYDRISGEIKHPPFSPTILFKDNSIEVNHNDNPPAEPHIFGVRYLIENGIIPAYLDGTEPQYTEGHSRTLQGITTDGKHIQMVSEGAYPNQGLTLKECAEVLKQHGALHAFDTGGGGDTTLFVNGSVLNKTEDIVNGVNVERYIPQILLIYPKGATTMATAISTTHNLSLRPLHQTINSSTILSIPMNTTLTVLDGWKAPETTQYNNINDEWVKVTYGGQTGWVGLVHLGVRYGTTDYVFNAPPPPPPPVPDGVELVFTENGVTKRYKMTGTWEVS